MRRFESVWKVPDGHVETGRFPGFVGAVRIGGHTEVCTGGRLAVDPGSAPMRPDVLFRIASVTKPVGAALALNLVEEGVLALDDPVARWLPEAADPRVLARPDAPLDETTAAVRPVTVRHHGVRRPAPRHSRGAAHAARDDRSAGRVRRLLGCRGRSRLRTRARRATG